MNFRQRLLRLCTPGCGLLLIVSVLAIARPAFGGTISGDIKNSIDADKHRPEIAAAVTVEIADLTGDDLAKRGKAREALIGEVNAPANLPFSGTFLDTFAQELNKQLLPLTDNTDPRVRLNVAIIVARVAEKVDSTRLFDVTDKLLADKSNAVLMWALKAAHFVLQPLLQAGLPQQQKKLIDDIKSHAAEPLLLPLVYEALSLNTSKSNVQGWNKMVQVSLKEILDLVKAREAIYLKQIPPDPAAEKFAVTFLSASNVWREENPQQQLQTVQVLSDLFSLAGNRALVAPAGQDREQLIFISTRAGEGLAAIALISKNDALFQDLSKTAKIDLNNSNAATQIAAVYTKLKAVAAWAALQPPPKIETAPGTAPTTSTVAASAPAK